MSGPGGRSSGLGDQTGRITRGDIESKLRDLKGEAQEVEESVKKPLAVVGGVVVVVVLGIVFLLGKRRGRRETTTVEIRRV